MRNKKEVFNRICAFASKDALIASTTSSFLVNELAQFVTNKERFLNTHWLNPAYLIPLVEVSPGSETGEDNLDQMVQLLEDIGKVPVKCAPSPGFIVPRIQALAMNEAARLSGRGGCLGLMILIKRPDWLWASVCRVRTVRIY